MSTTLTVTQPLRDEHEELRPHIDLLSAAGDAIGSVPVPQLRDQIGGAYAFLTEHLIPHARAEDAVLYPAVGQLMGSPEATATMSRDHVEVVRLTDELGWLRHRLEEASQLNTSDAMALRRVLYGLAALIKVHFAKEEEIYLPLLDARLSPIEATEIFEAMGHAERQANGRASV